MDHLFVGILLEETNCLGECNNWDKFVVETVAYDFQNQTTRIICKFLDNSQLKRQSRKSFTSNYPEATMTVDERIQMFEKRAEAIAANTPKLSFETFFNETSLEEAVDNELEILKRQILD